MLRPADGIACSKPPLLYCLCYRLRGDAGIFYCFSSCYFGGTAVSPRHIVPGSCGECWNCIQIKLIRVQEGLSQQTHFSDLFISRICAVPSLHRWRITAGARSFMFEPTLTIGIFSLPGVHKIRKMLHF